MSEIVRSIRVKIFDKDSQPRDQYYVVGGNVGMGVDEEKKPIRKIISNIEVMEDAHSKFYRIYVTVGNEVQIWKDEPANQYCTPEYSND